MRVTKQGHGWIYPRVISLAALAALSLGGCKKQTPIVDDPTLTANVQQRIAGDSSIASEPIQVSVTGGTATLNGQVSNAAARTLAANDAAGVTGVQKVINNLVVAANTPPVSATATTPLPKVQPLPVERPRERVKPSPSAGSQRVPAPVDRASASDGGHAPIDRQPTPVATAPAAPPAPVMRNITLPAGSTLPVRITQALDSATTQTGDTFSGALATDINSGGMLLLPRGTPVTGRVVEAKDAAHFKGSASLSIELTGVNRRGERIAVATEPFVKEGEGRGKNTAIKTGVGAAAGALLGGIFGGGKGAAIGAAAGGGTGAGINAVTRGQQVQIPSETVVRFKTTNDISVRTSAVATSTSDTPRLQSSPRSSDGSVPQNQ